MTIEIVDLPIQKWWFSMVFCRFFRIFVASHRPPNVEERREIEAQWSHQDQLVRFSGLGVHHQLGSGIQLRKDGNWWELAVDKMVG